MKASDLIEELNQRIADLEQAIRDADGAIGKSEGVGLLHFMDAESASGKLIAATLEK